MFVFVYAPSVLAICFAPCTSLAHDLSPACPLVGSLSLALLLALFPTPSLLKFLSCVARCTLQAGRPDPYAYVPFDKRQINKKKSHQPKKTLSKVVCASVCAYVPVFASMCQCLCAPTSAVCCVLNMGGSVVVLGGQHSIGVLAAFHSSTRLSVEVSLPPCLCPRPREKCHALPLHARRTTTSALSLNPWPRWHAQQLQLNAKEGGSFQLSHCQLNHCQLNPKPQTVVN